jgi:4-amino-4-deoxy-L-arabinose transferase-like glycosyltransferase
VVAFTLGLGAYSLTDPDEAVYGQVAREMVAPGGSWLTPHFQGGLWFDKPPLHYWASALSVKLLGLSEVACRLPSVLAALALVFLVYLWSRRVWDTRSALFAALILASSLQTMVLARAAVTDMLFAACLTASLLLLERWSASSRPRTLVLSALACGLAVLAKGPVALVLVGLVALPLVIRRRPKRPLPSALGFLAISALIYVPWYGAMLALHGDRFIQGFLVANNLTRYLSPEHPKTQSAFYFLPVLLVFFYPWSCLLPLVAGRFARCWRELDRPEGFLAVWALVVLLFFSASQTKLVTYIYPAYPALGLLLAKALAEGAPRKWRLWLALPVVLSIALALVLPGLTRRSFPTAPTLVALVFAPSIVLLLGAWVATWRSRQGSPIVWALALANVSLGVLAATVIMPRLEPSLSLRDLLAHRPSGTAGEPLVTTLHDRPSVWFYARSPVASAALQDAVDRLPPPPRWLLAERRAWGGLTPELQSRYKEVSGNGKYLLLRQRANR